MLDYLEQLIKEQKWEEALVIAEQLLLDQQNTVEDQLRINLALITARTWLGEYAGVVLLGDHAARIAADLEEWETFLTIHHYLGFSYFVLEQLLEAKKVWVRFIEHLPKVGHRHMFEVMTWFHLGIAAEKESDLNVAVSYFLKAREVAERNGNRRQVLGLNHALINAYTKLSEFHLVPPLLASAASYLRNNHDVADGQKARLYHLQVRANFALSTKRYIRAKLVATRALTHSADAPANQFNIHMILAAVAKQMGSSSEMVDHYLRARVSAIRARRYDCEVNAAESLYSFIQSHPGAFETSLSDLVSQEIPSAWFEMDGVPSRRSRTS